MRIICREPKVPRTASGGLVTALCLGVSFAAALPGRTAERYGADGFSICALTADNPLGDCEPLSDQAMQRFGLSAEEMSVVARLRRFAVKPESDLLRELAKSFAPPQPLDTPNFSDHWLPERPDQDGSLSDCFVCGVHFRYLKSELYQMSYAVRGGGFIVTWNRVFVQIKPQ